MLNRTEIATSAEGNFEALRGATFSGIRERRAALLVDRFSAMHSGVAIGDALGLPYETLSAAEIGQNFQDNPHYREIRNHRYIKDCPAGTTSDDEQLTRATMRGLVAAQELSIESQAQALVEAYHESTLGWGGTTRKAVERLISGTHPSDSGRFEDERAGVGNGVSMRLAPLAAFIVARGESVDHYIQKIADFTGITHATSVAVQCSLAHVAALCELLQSSKETFDAQDLVETLVKYSRIGQQFYTDRPASIDMPARFELLHKVASFSQQDIIDSFGAGICPVFHSLPFSFAFFLQNPFSFEAVYNSINAGGDTDSNGSIVGALLGALNGQAVVPKDYLNLLPSLANIRKDQAQFSVFLNSIVEQSQ